MFSPESFEPYCEKIVCFCSIVVLEKKRHIPAYASAKSGQCPLLLAFRKDNS